MNSQQQALEASQRLMHETMIQFNNQGVKHIEYGNIFKAFEFFSHAADMLPSILEEDDSMDYVEIQEYHYDCYDCNHIFKDGVPDKILHGVPTQFDEGLLSFINKKFIVVQPLNPNPEAGLPVYGFGWVIRYNLSVLCAIYGTCLGERGYQLCRRADMLMDQVQSRIEDELVLSPSKPWFLFLFDVLHNQACVAREVGKLDEMIGHLQDIYNQIALSPYDFELGDCEMYALSARWLLESTLLAGAA